MGKCVIVCAGEPCRLESLPEFSVEEGDYVICADGGLDFALAQGLPIHLVVGDFDSSACTQSQAKALGLPVYEVPSEKDDTDTMLAIKTGLERGYRDFLLYGCLGGRLDHAYANLQALTFLARRGASGWLLGEGLAVTAIRNGRLDFAPEHEGVISVFCPDGEARGVTLTGLHYPLRNAVLTSAFPLGVSNRFTGEAASVSVEDGTLLIMWDIKEGQLPEQLAKRR